MRLLLRKTSYALDLIRKYVATAQSSQQRIGLFKDVETYCMFAGFSRTGHTITAALLDAHPETTIAQELGILKHLRFGFKRARLYDLILRNSRERALHGRNTKGYSYGVEGQWQGRFSRIRVIGDQQAEGVTRRLRNHPHLLQRLRDEVGVPIRVIFTIRNPFDNITTFATRARDQPYLRAVGFSPKVSGCIDPYFELCESVMEIRSMLKPEEIIEFRHETFIENPREQLTYLCHELGLEVTEPYLQACVRIVNKSPHKTRYECEWTPEMKAEVSERMKEFPFLEGYTFEN